MLAQASSPGQTESLALADEWRPSTNGTYVIKVFTKLVGDMVPMDDTATVELHVVTMPATLTYDSGTPVHTWYFYQAGNGWGNRFVPPVYPCSVQSIRLFMSMITAPSKPFVGIFDDKGPGGGPGDTLFDTTVTDSATSPGSWYTVTLPSPVVIDSGAFYVGAISVVDSECAFGMDSVPPLSNQRWECTAGSWASSNDPSQGDFMANATISGPVGIFETTQPALTKVPMRIDVSPNPFGGMTSIRLLNARGLEKTIEIYDATGSVVRTLGVSRDQAVLDGRHLAGGIYFARVVGAEAPVAKVIVTH